MTSPEIEPGGYWLAARGRRPTPSPDPAASGYGVRQAPPSRAMNESASGGPQVPASYR
jgi:hypothetical protein